MKSLGINIEVSTRMPLTSPSAQQSNYLHIYLPTPGTDSISGPHTAKTEESKDFSKSDGKNSPVAPQRFTRLSPSVRFRAASRRFGHCSQDEVILGSPPRTRKYLTPRPHTNYSKITRKQGPNTH